MSKGVFLCVGTGCHVLPAYNVIKSMLNQGLDKKNILVVTDERGVEYFKDKDIEIIVYPFVSSQKGIGAYLLKLIKMLKSIIFLYKSLKKHKPKFLFTTGAYIAPIAAIAAVCCYRCYLLLLLLFAAIAKLLLLFVGIANF